MKQSIIRGLIKIIAAEDNKDKSRVIELWKQGKSLEAIQKMLGVKIEVPGSIGDLHKNILDGKFEVI